MAPDSDSGKTATGWRDPAIFQVALLLATLIALVTGRDLSQARQLWLIALAGSSAIWHWISVIEPGKTPDSRPPDVRFAVLALVILLALWYLLILIHPAFHLLLIGFYSLFFATLPKTWAATGSLLLTALALLKEFS